MNKTLGRWPSARAMEMEAARIKLKITASREELPVRTVTKKLMLLAFIQSRLCCF
jgi:hypothetical protein